MKSFPGRHWFGRWAQRGIVLAAALLAGTTTHPAEAGSWPQVPDLLTQGLSPEQQCRVAIKRQETASGMPESMMVAISLVESGRRMPNGEVAAWPWSINVQGVGHVYESKAEAIAAVRAFQAQGVQSIDVGCMQVNLMYHAGAFASLEDAFDPVRNAAYAAKFLTELRTQTGSWQQATADYHSATPELGQPYERKVAALMSGPAVRDLQQSADATTQASPIPGGGMRPASAQPAPAPAVGGVRQAPVFFAKAPVQMLRMPDAGAGRSLAAYRLAPVMLNSRAQLFRPAWR